MRQRFLALVASLALTLGLLVGFASPASAHHTHNPNTMCAIITLAHPSWVPVSFHSHYNSAGHPVWAHCVYYVKWTFAPRDMCRNYLHHTTWDC